MLMQYPREFFELQLVFARKTTAVTQKSYQETILHYTALYRILGLDWSFDPSNPIWRAYLQGLQSEKSDTEWTYQFYLTRFDQLPQYRTPRWGCFSYEYYAETQVIRIHFANLDVSGYGPLTTRRKEARLVELASMFKHIQEKHPVARMVQGGTWLYNRHEYKRLFPVEYGQSARIDKPHLQTRGLWGQFLRHDGKINEKTASLFLERISQLQLPEYYAQCFPYQSLLTKAPIELFYEFYRI